MITFDAVMPIIKSAKKKLRQDKKRTSRNLKIKLNIKNLLKQARRQATPEKIQSVSSALDKAVKTKFIHKNKAARLKSRLAKLDPSTNIATKTTAKKTTSKPKSKTSRK